MKSYGQFMKAGHLHYRSLWDMGSIVWGNADGIYDHHSKPWPGGEAERHIKSNSVTETLSED